MEVEDPEKIKKLIEELKEKNQIPKVPKWIKILRELIKENKKE